MPLPVENVDWPPPEVMDALNIIGEWDLWYGGDPDQLAQHGEDTDQTAHGSRSWRFWSRRRPTTSANSRRERLHVPVPGDIASTSADLLFANPVDISVPGIRQDADQEEQGRSERQATQDRIEEILDRSALLNRLLEAAEECAATGGIYLRPTWHDAIPYPILTHITPDRAVPTFRYGTLTEVTFWRTLTEEGESPVLRHLEHHSVQGLATIENALYRGTEDKVGVKVDLGNHPFTAPLEERIQIPGIKGLACRYVPNMRPARRLRGTPHGRSDFDGIEGLFDAIDEAWNSWMRDLRLGKAHLIVPSEYLERSAVGRGAAFDLDQELFTPLAMDPTEREKAGIEQVQFKIRYQEHQATVEALVMEAVGKAGYSAQTFGFHGDSDTTATEVVARKDKTFRTTGKKRRYWEPNTEDILEIMLAIDRHILRNTKVTVLRPDIEWPGLDEPGPKAVAETVDLLARAEAASKDTLVRMQHPEWSDAEVLAEVERIMDAQPSPLPNPFDMGDESIPEDEEPEEEPDGR